MGNVPRFKQAIPPSIEDIQSMLKKNPIFGAEDPVVPDPAKPPVTDPPNPAESNPLEQSVKDLQTQLDANAAELKKYKDAEEAAQRKNNTDLDNYKKDLQDVTDKWSGEERRANGLAARLDNEILINKILATGKFKSEAIEFVVQKLDREKVKVNLETREVTNLDKALEEVGKNFALFLKEENSVTPGGAGNGSGPNGSNQNGNPWARAGSPPAPPATKSQEASQRESMVGRYAALRSGR